MPALSTRSRRLAAPALTTAVLALLAAAAPASASLTPLRPTASSPVTYFGHGGYSSDGAGGTGDSVLAEIPAGSQIEQAYLYGSFQGGYSSLGSDGDVTFDGAPVTLNEISYEPGIYWDEFITGRADVTAAVAARVGAGGSTVAFPVERSAASQHGFGLVVIYSNPSSPEVSVAILDGFAAPAGDRAKLYFAGPLDTTVPGFRATMALGIGWSAGTDSLVDVNGQRLTSAAGGQDDSVNDLITVGGVGDSTANPANPNAGNPEADDELYDLAPFVHQGDTELTVDTFNASDNDAIFVSVIEIAAEAAVGVNGALPPQPAAPAPSALTTTGAGTAVQSKVLTVPTGGSAALVVGGSTTSSHTIPGQGTYSMSPAGVISFVPVTGYVGTATPITYRFTDRFGQTGDATYTATVTRPAGPAADPLRSIGTPGQAQSRTITIPSGGSATLLDAQGAAVRSVRIPGQGEYVLDEARATITFTPEPGFRGLASPVSYRISDAYGQSRDATFQPDVSVEATAPTAPAPVAGPSAAAPQAVAACVSLRAMTLHWKLPSRVTATKFVVTVNGKRQKTLNRRARATRISLAGRPAQKVTVKVSTRAKNGKTYQTVRAYTTCRVGIPSTGPKTLRLTRAGKAHR